MATIKARRQADGTIRYAAISQRRVGKEIHRSAADSWARNREVELK